MVNLVTAATFNYRTPDLTEVCARTFKEHYPDIPLIIVENSAGGKSEECIDALRRTLPNVSIIFNRKNIGDFPDVPLPKIGIMELRLGRNRMVRVLDTMKSGVGEPFLRKRVVRKLLTGGNIGHGPALHQVLMLCKTPYLFALDSDCIVQRGGFIERMLEPFEDKNTYAVGRMVFLDKRGTAHPPRMAHRYDQHIHESVIMLDVEKYRLLLPYVHFGVPSLLNMPFATAVFYKLVNYNVGGEDTEIHHLFRGSRKLAGGMPGVRNAPIMPWVLLHGLKSEYRGGYFE